MAIMKEQFQFTNAPNALLIMSFGVVTAEDCLNAITWTKSIAVYACMVQNGKTGFFPFCYIEHLLTSDC